MSHDYNGFVWCFKRITYVIHLRPSHSSLIPCWCSFSSMHTKYTYTYISKWIYSIRLQAASSPIHIIRSMFTRANLSNATLFHIPNTIIRRLNNNFQCLCHFPLLFDHPYPISFHIILFSRFLLCFCVFVALIFEFGLFVADFLFCYLRMIWPHHTNHWLSTPLRTFAFRSTFAYKWGHGMF